MDPYNLRSRPQMPMTTDHMQVVHTSESERLPLLGDTGGSLARVPVGPHVQMSGDTRVVLGDDTSMVGPEVEIPGEVTLRPGTPEHSQTDRASISETLSPPELTPELAMQVVGPTDDIPDTDIRGTTGTDTRYSQQHYTTTITTTKSTIGSHTGALGGPAESRSLSLGPTLKYHESSLEVKPTVTGMASAQSQSALVNTGRSGKESPIHDTHSSYRVTV